MKYIILGLNALGRALGKRLTQSGNEVIGVDKNESVVDETKHEMTGTICMDTTDEDALGSLPLSDIDTVIVAYGKEFGVSVKTVALLKNLQVDHIIVRSISPIQEAVVRAIGITEIIYPEQEFADYYISQTMIGDKLKGRFNVSDGYDLFKITVPSFLVGQTIKSARFEDNFNLRIVGVERLQEKKNILGITQKQYAVVTPLSEDLELIQDDILLLFGDIDTMRKFVKT
jgi:trk system potassium uptake protein TrkA